MPFSSVLGASSVVKPGVCTSTTRPTVPYEGQLIYETDTDRVASYNGSAWVYTHSSGLILVKSQTVGTAVSSVVVNDAFSASYDNYIVSYQNGTCSGSGSIGIQMGSTTSGYYYSIFGNTWSATFSSAGSTSVSQFFYLGTLNSTNGPNLFATIQSPFLSKSTFASGMTLPTSGAYFAAGMLLNTTSYTGFTMIADTGTLTGGTIRVYGYAI